MDYIEIDKFMEQPEKVQEIFKKHHNDYHKYNVYVTKGIPLVEESELRQFIKSRGYRLMSFNNFFDDKWNFKVLKNGFQLEPSYEVICDKLIDCYWEVACMIAAEEDK